MGAARSVAGGACAYGQCGASVQGTVTRVLEVSVAVERPAKAVVVEINGN